MDEILQAITTARPPLRLCAIAKQDEQQCGFHLSRSQWDPYPWISNVDQQSPAAKAGLTMGDFVIEVNGEDILGLSIEQVAEKVRQKKDSVVLLVWKAAVPETEIKFPPVFHFQKFSYFLQSALQLIECPVCMESACAPTYQCVNGHILCLSCVVKTSKCPMCRVPLSGKGRCLIVERLHDLIRKTIASNPNATDNNNLTDQKIVCQPRSWIKKSNSQVNSKKSLVVTEVNEVSAIDSRE